MYERLKSAAVLRAELAVTAFCFLLPDLVDKPLWMLGIGMGRFVGHTLLFGFLVAFVFFLRKRTYGLFALVGGMSHLLWDAGTFMPWLYPFVKYDFPQLEFWGFFRWYMVAILFGQLALVILLAMSLLLWLSSRRKKLGKPRALDNQAVKRGDKR
jgi:hypothetical protein